GNRQGDREGNREEGHESEETHSIQTRSAPPTDVITQRRLCPSGLFSSPQCCNTFLLGIIGLGCNTPNSIQKLLDYDDFRKECGKSAQKAQCCVAPVENQAILCLPAYNP
ncbi:fungal hydrophobin domain-containing protein, partial [Trichoderma chlorosporum]